MPFEGQIHTLLSKSVWIWGPVRAGVHKRVYLLIWHRPVRGGESGS